MAVTTVVGEETVVFEGTYLNRRAAEIVCPVPPLPGHVARIDAALSGSWYQGVQWAGPSFLYGIEADLVADPPISLNCGVAPADSTLHHRVRIRLNNTVVATGYTHSVVISSAPASFDEEFTGTWRITVPTEIVHVAEDLEVTEPGLVDADGFPEFSPDMPDSGLVAVQEGTVGKSEKWYRRAKIGESVLIEVGDVTYSHEITSGNQYVLNHETRSFARLVSQDVAGEIYVTSNFQGQPIGQPLSHTHTDGTEYSIEHGAKVSCPGSGDFWASANLVMTPDKRLGFRGRVACFESDYPGSVTARVLTVKDGGYADVVLSPGGSAEWSQRRFAYTGLSGAPGFESTVWEGDLDEWQPVRAWLRPTSLTANGEDEEDWRLPLYSVRWDAFRLQHLPESLLTDDDEGWSSVANTVVSEVGGAVQIAVSGGEGSAKWEPDEDVSCEAWRYLRVKIKAAGANKPFRIKLTHAEGEDKEFSGTTGAAGTYTDIDIDLCFADDRPFDHDDQESRWPLKGSGLPPLDALPLWGVNSFDTLTIVGLEEDETYTVESINLVRKSWSQVSFVSAHKLWRDETDGGSKTVRPLFYSDVDGRFYDWWGHRKSGHEWKTITGAMSDFFLPGWVASDPGSANTYHDNDLEAEFLEGRGLLYDASSMTPWTLTCRRSVTHESEGTLVRAQAQVDEIDVFPEAGDVWGGSYGGRCYIGGGKLLRNQVEGVTFGAQGSVSGRTVYLLGAADADRGSGTSGLLGHYKTGTPFAGHDEPVKARCKVVETDPWTTFSRIVHRRCFIVPGGVGGVALADRGDKYLAKGVVEDGEVVVSFAYSGQEFGGDVATGFESGVVALAWEPRNSARLHMLTVEEGAVVKRFTDDDGQTWSEPVTVGGTSAGAVALAVAPDGIAYCYWYEGGTVKGRRMDASGSFMETAFDAQDSADDAGVAAAMGRGSGGQETVEMLHVDGGEVQHTRSDDGITFA